MHPQPWVRHDRLDDTVMVIDLEQGTYFSFGETAADAWTLFATGHDIPSAADVLLTRYDTTHDVVSTDLASFAGGLIAEGLLSGEVESETAWDTLPAFEDKRPYVEPLVKRHDELADLIMLDPIHEVDESVGWPAPPVS